MSEYWINDGIHWSVTCIMNDTTNVTVVSLGYELGKETHPSTVFGPTCDALDTVLTGQQLPEMKVGDWLVSPNMGVYTTSLGSNFTGFSTSAIRTHLAF